MRCHFAAYDVGNYEEKQKKKVDLLHLQLRKSEQLTYDLNKMAPNQYDGLVSECETSSH